jgi:capsular polysaccharide biosynthesis protein
MEPKATNNEEIEIDLRELFFVLLEHIRMIIASTILVALIAFAYSKLLVTPMYASTAELYVLSKSTSITSITDLQVGTNLTSDYMEVISGRPVLDQVIENLGLDMEYADLYKQVSLNNPANSRIMKITVTDSNPENAKVIADEIAEVSAAYISQKMDQDPPTIIQQGYSDEGPVSPSVAKNTAVGAFLGFILAAAFVIVGYLLNDTIMTPDDLENVIGIHVLASLPLDESEDDGESKPDGR